MKRIYVQHEDGPELGLISPEFRTEEEARRKRDEWNKEVPGHRVIIINESESNDMLTVSGGRKETP